MQSIDIHAKNKDGSYTCCECGKTYSSRGIGTHYWRKHGDGKDWKENNKNRKAWNKGLSKNNNKSLLNASIKMKEKYASGELKPNGFCADGYHQTDKAKESMSRGGGFRENAGRGIKTHFKNIKDEEFLLRSSFELKLAKFLNSKGIYWVQPKSFKYILDDKEKRYFPDFYLPGYDLIIETKNDYLFSLQKEKMQAIKKYSDCPIIIMLNRDIENLEEVVCKILKLD